MRQIVLLCTLVFLLSGCMDEDKNTFSGSEDNWDVSYEAVVTNEVEQRTAGNIKYIGENNAPETLSYEIKYNNKGQGSMGEEIPLKFGVVKFEDGICGNCDIIQNDDKIEVEIMWEGKTEKIMVTAYK